MNLTPFFLIGFWDRDRWDKDGLRVDKIYITFDNPDIVWGDVKMIEK